MVSPTKNIFTEVDIWKPQKIKNILSIQSLMKLFLNK